jgi:integral membrane protein
MANPIRVLRRVAFAEGTSFLVLLGIAMPLKHLAGQPLWVTIFGSIHGALFLWVCVALAATRRIGRSIGRMAAVVMAALLPFGTFVIDAWLRRWQGEVRRDADRTLAA